MRDSNGLVKYVLDETEYLVYLKYVHNGVDLVAANSNDWIVSLGNYRVHEILNRPNRNPPDVLLTLERIGTDRHTTIRHLDPTDVNKLYVGQVFKKGERIVPYPGAIFGPSTGIHIYVEENRLFDGSGRVFVDPETHSSNILTEGFGGTYYYIKDEKDHVLPTPFRGDDYNSWPYTSRR